MRGGEARVEREVEAPDTTDGRQDEGGAGSEAGWPPRAANTCSAASMAESTKKKSRKE